MCSDHLGNFVYTWTGIEGNGEPIWAEIKATLLAVSFAHNMGLKMISFLKVMLLM